MYELASHYRDYANNPKKVIAISLENTIEYFGLKKIENGHVVSKYSVTEIVRRVFNPSINELKKKSDVWLEIIKPVKDGRKVVGWKLRVVSKNKKLLPIFNATPVINPKDQAKSKPLKLVDQLVTKFKLSQRQADLLITKVDPKALKKELYQINLLILDRKLRNIGGYTAKVLGAKFNLKL